jgi:hypothetical protein
MTAQTHPQRADNDLLLRRSMQADAVVTAIVALGAMVESGLIAPWLGVPPLALVILGAILLGWAAALWMAASRPTISRRFAWLSVILGAVWVVDSVVLLVSGWLPFTTEGWWLVAIVALAVAGFTEAQYIGLRRR